MTTFECHIDLLNGFAFKSASYTENEKDIQLLRGDNIEPGALRWRGAKRWPVSSSTGLEKYNLKEGDFVIAMDRTWISSGLKVAEVKLSDLPCLLVQRVARIRAKNTLEQGLLRQYFSSHNFEQYVKSVQTETAVPHISAQQIKDFPLLLPPRQEQTKIAQILSTWDKAIASTERLLANSQRQKQALMRPLLSGQKRFADYPDWINTPISKLLTESRLPGSNGETAKKITVKLYGNGVVAKDEKRIGSESTKYFTRKAGQFIYSKLDFLNGAFGIIPKHLDGYESTLDLPAFNFTEHVAPAWLTQYISREEFYSAQLGLANGGRKARRVNPTDLLKVEVPLPSLPEQQKIAQVLSTADAEIANLQAQLAKLKLEKKALMQQLLSGQRRVRVAAEADEEQAVPA